MPTKSQVFLADGTFNVPPTVSAVWATYSGAGSGGYGQGFGSNLSGGACGEYVLSRLIPCTPSGTLAIVIGVGGTGASGNDGWSISSMAGTDTTVGSWIANASKTTLPAPGPGTHHPPIGGGVGGGSVVGTKIGFREGPRSHGGFSTSWGVNRQDPGLGVSNTGGAGSAVPGSAGGSGNLWLKGGDGASNGPGNNAAANSGAAGSAGGATMFQNGGNGGSGRVELFWTEPT